MSNCLCCKTKFEPKQNTTGKYCSRSCAAKINNVIYPKRKKSSKIPVYTRCKQCDKKLIKGRQQQFCSHDCRGRYIKSEKFRNWLDGKVAGNDKHGELLQSIRYRLIEKANGKCTKCGWGEVNEKVGYAILTIDHVDGDWENNSPQNVQVICYNCHTLTATFCALNRNGKAFKRRGGTLIRSS